MNMPSPRPSRCRGQVKSERCLLISGYRFLVCMGPWDVPKHVFLAPPLPPTKLFAVAMSALELWCRGGQYGPPWPLWVFFPPPDPEDLPLPRWVVLPPPRSWPRPGSLGEPPNPLRLLAPIAIITPWPRFAAPLRGSSGIYRVVPVPWRLYVTAQHPL